MDDEVRRREQTARLAALSQPAVRERRRQRRRAKLRRSVPWLVTGTAAAAIVTAAVILPRSGLGTPPPAGLAPVTNGPVPRLSPALTDAQPFAGTPAVSWADGAAGIVLPPAHRTGPFTAAQVAAAYRMTRKLLVAANLDPRTLHGGSPDAFANLLTRRERVTFVRGLDQPGADKRGFTRSTRIWVSSFAPGSQLVGDVVKVNGTMSARTAAVSGARVLQVAATYLFAYPVQQPGRPSTLMRVVVRAAPLVDFYQWDDPGGPLEPWWNNKGDWSGIRCDVQDGYIHPDFPAGQPDKVRARGAAVSPYQLTRPRSRTSCHPTTGT